MLDDDKARDFIHAYLDGQLSDDEVQQLNEWIKYDPNNTREFCKVALLHDRLNDAMIAQSRLADDESGLALQSRASSQQTSAFESQGKGRGFIWGIAGIAILLLVAIFLLRPTNTVDPSVIPEIIRLDGKVDVQLADGTTSAAKIGDRIQPGETVAAQGNDFGSVSAALEYPDGTKLHLVNATTVTNRSVSSKQMEIDHGAILASVMPQPAKHPMLFTARKLQVKVVGTDLVVRTTEETTGVSVTKGRVEVIQNDGKSVEVTAGKQVVAGSEPDLVVEAIQGPVGSWTEDFENGLPADWRLGKLVTEGLPSGSKGAIQASTNDQREHFGIYTPQRWVDGLFVTHPDSHLHFTFKMPKVNWINIFMLSRTGDPADSTICLHLHSFEDDSLEANQWYKATIPLSAFLRRVSEEDTFHEDPFKSGELIVDMLWSSPKPDRGLVIDEVEVSRGGPGERRIVRLGNDE